MDGQSRNQLGQLKVRALDMLSKFEEIGPLQDHTSMFHLIIELIIQAMRWGPPSSYWCYFLERIMGYLVRGIKSKRHAEANIMSRFRNTLVPCHAFQNPRFASLEAELSQPTKSIRLLDKFPKRAPDGSYRLLAADHEDLHEIFLGLSRTYARAARECVWVHSDTALPGHTFQQWKPWLEPTCKGSATWANRNTISLASAVAAFKVDQLKRFYSGVFYGGERRTGSKTDSATSTNKHAHSTFVFTNHVSLSDRIGKIIFMFQLALPAIVCENVGYCGFSIISSFIFYLFVTITFYLCNASHAMFFSRMRRIRRALFLPRCKSWTTAGYVPKASCLWCAC